MTSFISFEIFFQLLSAAFQEMSQDEKAYTEYIPLSLYLASDFFLLHSSKDVQLLVACCIAEVLRIFAPDAPYKDEGQIKVSSFSRDLSNCN